MQITKFLARSALRFLSTPYQPRSTSKRANAADGSAVFGESLSSAGLVKDTVEGLLDKSGDPMGLASLYDSRFQRSFTKTMEELRRAKQSRRVKELHALEQLKGIALAHIQQNATFDPAKFGFVISRDFVFNQAHLANAKKTGLVCRRRGHHGEKSRRLRLQGAQRGRLVSPKRCRNSSNKSKR